MATWAVSDLHGNYELFLAILDKINPEDTVYFLGDACDRGHDGYDLMKSIWEQPNWIYLMGNHEEMFIEATQDYLNYDRWVYDTYSYAVCNGAYETLYCWELDGEVERKIWHNRITRLPMGAEYINTNGKRIFLCHSGFTPVMNRHTKIVTMYENDSYHLLWDRDHMYNNRWPSNMPDIYVVHGHTPIQYYSHGYIIDDGPLFYQKRHKIDIDCATYITNAAFIFNLDTFEHITVRV